MLWFARNQSNFSRWNRSWRMAPVPAATAVAYSRVTYVDIGRHISQSRRALLKKVGKGDDNANMTDFGIKP
jgi:hypothetical protein